MAETQYQVLDFKPGINKNTTPYHNEMSWVEGDKIRFSSGQPEKIGGWTRESLDTFDGTARDILSWISTDSRKQYAALATHTRLYAIDGGSLFDITPLRREETLTGPVETFAGTSLVNITDAGHNSNTGDTIVITSLDSFGGYTPTLPAEFTITSVIDANTYEIDTGFTFASNASGQGGTTVIEYLLSAGVEFNKAAFGWGAGPWSGSTWGTNRITSSLLTELRQWSLSTWGEDLIANVRGGGIYQWVENSGASVRAQLLPQAPEQCNFSLVSTPTRHLIAFGCTDIAGDFDPLLVRWASRETLDDWFPTDTNSAGFQRLEKGNFLMGAEQSRIDILVFTDEAAYTMNYQGQPFVFGFELIGSNAGLISQHATTNVNGVTRWMSNNSFYEHDGILKQIPCSVEDVLFESGFKESINYDQKEMIFSGVNQEFDEVIWLYPAGDSTFCNRYVIYNYLENVWYDGTLERSAWEESNIFDKPLATSREGILYTHEQGKDDDSNPMEAFVESGSFDLDKGDSMMYVDRLIPDFEQQGNLTFTIKTKKYPYSTQEVEKTYTVTSDKGLLNVRARGRQAQIRISSNTTNGSFQVGKPRLAMKPDGMR